MGRVNEPTTRASIQDIRLVHKDGNSFPISVSELRQYRTRILVSLSSELASARTTRIHSLEEIEGLHDKTAIILDRLDDVAKLIQHFPRRCA
jgi:hypothetical protein